MPRDIVPELRKLIAESGTNIKQLASDAGVGYHKLVRWYSGRTVILDVRMAERVYRHLTGRDFV